MATLNFDASKVEPIRFATFTFGLNRTQRRWADQRTLFFHEIAELLSKREIGDKDGPCYVPAALSGTERKLDQIEQIDVAVLDSDCGHTMEEIKAAVEARGLECIVHSTYSHMTDTTEIAAGPYEKWCGATPGGAVEGYMRAKKGYLPAVAAGAAIVGERMDGTARTLTVRHQPCPKFRIVLPLARPWRAADFPDAHAAARSWREGIGALAAALGLHHDQSCTDPSRLFYLPRSSRAGQAFESVHVRGKACDIWALPAAGAGSTLFERPGVDAPAVGQGPAERAWQGADGATFDLETWAAEYGPRFELATAVRTRAPGLLGSRVSGPKQHMLCPHNDAHTTDALDRTGTYAVDASKIGQSGLTARGGFYIGCSHAGCAGRDRLSFVARLLDDGHLTVADLTAPAFLMPEPPLPALKPRPKPAVPPGEELIGNIPRSVLDDLPGVLGEMVRFILATSPKPQPALALPAALCLMATAIGRKTELEGWGTRPNLYAICVAVSGAGKQRPITAVKDMARAAGLFDKLIGVETVASDAGINTAVVKKPSQVMLVDEVGFLLASAGNRNAGAHLANVVQTMLMLHSQSDTTYQGKSYADDDRNISVEQPCVSLYGASTPDKLFASLTTADIGIGLLSRATLFDAYEHDPKKRRPERRPVPAPIVDWLQAWDAVPLNENLVEMQGGQPAIRPRVIGLTADADALLDAFEDEMQAAKTKARQRGLDPIYVRAHENAAKFAMIRACAHGPQDLLIQAADARWGIVLARATTEHMARKADSEITDSGFQKLVKSALACIAAGKERGATFADLASRKGCKVPPKELEAALDHLVQSGQAVRVDVNAGRVKSNGVRVKARNAWVLAEHHDAGEGGDDEAADAA